MENQKISQSILQVQQELDCENSNIIKFKFLKDFSDINKNVQKNISPTANEPNIIQLKQQSLQDQSDNQNHNMETNQKMFLFLNLGVKILKLNLPLINQIQYSTFSQDNGSVNSYKSKSSTKLKKIAKKKNFQQLSYSEKIELTLNASQRFNKKIISKKQNISQHMKKIENNVKLQRQLLPSQQNQIQNFPFIVLENDKQYYNSNGSFKVGKTNIESFINMNVMQEQQMSYKNLNNGYDQMGYFKRFQRRKRRKRNAFGILEDRLPVP